MDELRQYYADMSARNWPAYSAHFWPRATITTIWQRPGASAAEVVTNTVDEFVAQAPQGPDNKPIFDERMLSADVRVTGRLAHAWASYEAKFGDSVNLERWRGIDAFTLMKHEGHWRITSLAFDAER